MDSQELDNQIGYDIDSSGPYKTLKLALHLETFRLWRFRRLESTELVQLEMKMFLFNGHTKSYTALSYAWGSDRSNLRAIIVNDELIHITANLWEFLNVLLSSGDYYGVWFWADQISMDQRNVDERNHQVRLMSTIYQEASHVFAYIGRLETPKHKPTAMEMEVASEIVETSPWEFGETQNAEECLYLLHMMTQDYWSRLWIVQELRLARELTVWFGGFSITRSEFLRSVEVLRWKNLKTEFEKWPLCRQALHEVERMEEIRMSEFLPARMETIIELLGPTGIQGHRFGLLGLLRRYCRQVCMDPRDKIFGLQALLLEADRLTVDYSKTYKAVFWDALMVGLPKDKHLTMEPLDILQTDETLLTALLDTLEPVDAKRAKATVWSCSLKGVQALCDLGSMEKHSPQATASIGSYRTLSWRDRDGLIEMGKSAVTVRQKHLAHDISILQHFARLEKEQEVEPSSTDSLNWAFHSESFQDRWKETLEQKLVQEWAREREANIGEWEEKWEEESERNSRHISSWEGEFFRVCRIVKKRLERSGFKEYGEFLCHPDDWPLYECQIPADDE